MRRDEKFIYLCLFFVSGACGLTYEIIWSRLLVFVFGGTTFAITTVLTCFMGGLALGSWLAGRFTSQQSAGGRPERLYGVLEILIGLTALLVPALLEHSTVIYRALVGAFGESFVLITVARILISGVILLVPTCAMGATLPLLANAFHRHALYAAKTERGASRRGGVGSNVAVLYGANTFGAFVGCATAGFVLLPRLGLSASTWTVAALNLLAGIVALWISRRPIEPVAEVDSPGEALKLERPAEQPKVAKAPKGKKASQGKKAKVKTRRGEESEALAGLDRRLLLLLYGLSGFAAMAYQVAWTRALILSMGSSTYSFSTIVSCYIFGLAVGSLVMARRADLLRQPLHVAGVLQMTIALSALFVVPLFSEMPGVVAQATSSGAAFMDVLLMEAAWVFGLLIVPTLCMGALMPLICRVYDPTPEKVGRSLGDVYAANTAGTILGSAVAGFVLVPLSFMGMERTIHLASGLNLLVGTCFLLAPIVTIQGRPNSDTKSSTRSNFRSNIRSNKGRRAIVVGVWVLAALALGLTEPWSRETMTSGPYLGRAASAEQWEIVFYREGIDATVSVGESQDGDFTMSVNGKPDASTLPDDMVTQGLAGVIPLLQRPDARDVCLIGLGSGVTAGAILAFDIDRLDLAEISRAVIDGSRFFDDVSQAPLDDPRLHMHRNDGRNLLLLSDRRYDVIVSEPSNPWISGIANLFTREFFELSRDRLKPGGIHAQWLHGYSMHPDNFAAVLRTLNEVFGHVQIWEMAMNDYLMIASTEPFEIDVEELYFHMAQPDLQRLLEKIHITHPLQIAQHWVGRADAMSSWLDGALLLTDDLPYLEFSAPRFLLASTQGQVSERLFEADGLPSLVDPDGLLGRRFLAGAQASKTRGRAIRAAQRARERGDVDAAVDALTEAADAVPEDFRSHIAILIELRALADGDANGKIRELQTRLLQIEIEKWPFTRVDPWPMAEGFAYAGRKLLDEGGDVEEATAHLLRGWLRAPTDSRIIYDLARVYAARGELERAEGLLEQTVATGFATPEMIAAERLFDPLRQADRISP